MGTLQDWIKRHTEDYGQLVTNERQQQKIGGYANAVGRGLKQSFPMLEKQPQDVSIADMLSSGLGVMPATFIGPKAATWSAEKAAKSAKLLDEGADPAQVWKEHLIGRMPDGKLFSEIDDSGAYIKNNSLIHEVLDSNYNSLSDRVKFNQELPYGVNGERDLHGIEISENAKNPLSTAVHELGHDVQAAEGWQSGGSESFFPNKESLKKGKIIAKLKERGLDDEGVDKFFRQNLQHARLNNYPDKSKKVSSDILESLDKKKYYQSLSPEPYQNYRRLTGEAQARATQDRLNMSLEERRNNYPLAGGKLSDIPLKQLIYRYGDNGPAMAINKVSLLNKYAGSHRAPIGEEGNAPLHDLTQILPDDIYSSKAIQYYGTGDDLLDREAFAAFNKYRGKPDALVNIYRAVPKNSEDAFNHGDWVTLSKKYAKDHGESHLDDYKIIKEKVPAKSLFKNGDSPHEFWLDVSKIVERNGQSLLSDKRKLKDIK